MSAFCSTNNRFVVPDTKTRLPSIATVQNLLLATILLSGWGTSPTHAQVVRAWEFMPQFAQSEHLESSPAIGPDGQVFVATTTGGDFGNIYAVYYDACSQGPVVSWSQPIIAQSHGAAPSPAIGADGTIYMAGGREHWAGRALCVHLAFELP